MNGCGSYTYDANGNTLSDPSGKSYSWDFDNRLTQAVVPGSGTVNFKYDPFGRRIEKISPSFTSIFVYDADNLLETLNASGSEVASYTVCFRQACGTLVQKRVVIQDSRTMSANSGCTSEEGNPCHLRRHSRSHG